MTIPSYELRYNERSWAIDLISYINSILDKNKPIRRAGGEYSVAKDSQTLFPDVLLFGDESTGSILQGWELKMPDTSITDSELFKNASIKARNLGLNSFLLWNAVDVNLYVFNLNTDKYDLDPNFIISKLPYTTRVDVQNRPELWKECTKDIISRLNDYFTTGKIKAITPDIVFSDKGIITKILSCHAEVKEFLQQEVKKDKKIDASIKRWWRYVNAEYPGYKEPYSPLAYCIILRWFFRFVFTNILYAYNKIPENDELKNTDISITKALGIYKDICTKYDYWNVLGPAAFDELLPQKVWDNLVEIFNYMHNFEFSKINCTVLSEIVKSTVLTSIKKGAGLYATPSYVAELLVRLTLNEKDGYAIDPFCGTGTIINQILEIKTESNIDGRTNIMTTWGCDKFAFPVQIAALMFSGTDVIKEALRVFTHDAFSLEIGEEIDFIDSTTGSIRKYKVPHFSSIISNFPFVRFEDIAQLNPDVKSKILKFYSDYNISKTMQLDSKCDIYAYIPFLLYHLLADSGYLGFIISNSWLSTKAGKAFRKLLLKFYAIEAIVTSGVERWFADTKVVANIVICQKRQKIENSNETTSFVTVITELNDETNISDIADDIIDANKNSQDVIIKSYTMNTMHELENLGLSYNSCFGNTDWLTQNIDNFEKLNAYMSITRGERRGWDKLFYPNNEAIIEIEDEYLRPVLKTAKGKFAYIFEPDEYAFCCGVSMEDLKEYGHDGAFNWIKKFESAVNEKGKPLTKVLARNNRYWYQMADTAQADFVLSMNPDTKIFIQRFMKPSFTNQRLINISAKTESTDKELFHALLNSTIIISQIEALGFGRGETVLDINPTNLRNGLYIPKIENISDKDKEKIKHLFLEIKEKPVMSIPEILNSKIRMNFDKIIFESLNIKTEYVDDVYENLKYLYNIRKAAR